MVFPSISSLEMLDEVEELDLVLAHYAVTWGLKLPSGQQLGSPSKWVEWGLKAPAYTDNPDSDSD
jgi:[phosphatase 2A protein]-leucine-carboxy methyltransferase